MPIELAERRPICTKVENPFPSQSRNYGMKAVRSSSSTPLVEYSMFTMPFTKPPGSLKSKDRFVKKSYMKQGTGVVDLEVHTFPKSDVCFDDKKTMQVNTIGFKVKKFDFGQKDAVKKLTVEFLGKLREELGESNNVFPLTLTLKAKLADKSEHLISSAFDGNLSGFIVNNGDDLSIVVKQIMKAFSVEFPKKDQDSVFITAVVTQYFLKQNTKVVPILVDYTTTVKKRVEGRKPKTMEEFFSRM